MAEIPLIDISDDGDISKAAETLRRTCESHGFFFLTGHGIAEEERDKMFELTKAFFALSKEEKDAVEINKWYRGYTRYGEEKLDPKNQSCGDTKEGFYMGLEPTPDEVGKFPLLGENNWPAEEQVPGFRATLESYRDKMCDLGRRVNRVLAVALGQPETYFDYAFRRPLGYVRLLHYSEQKSDVDAGILSCGAHSDFGCITYLLTDGEPGLQLLAEGEWKDVKEPPGTYICNIGDMLERWSNSTFPSTKHRVVNKTGRERYSIPFFFDPAFDALVAPVPSCGEPKFEPIYGGDYMIECYSKYHQDFPAKTQS